MPMQAILQRDFSGGVNLTTNPYLVQPKQITSVRNMLLDEHGSISTRDGSSTISTSPDTTNPIVYRGVLNKVSGASFPYAIQNNGTINTLRRTDLTPWTTVGSTSTAFLIPSSITVIDTEVIAAGYETPRTWDGTTWSQITALAGQVLPPGAQHIAFHLGSVWIWNTAAATTATDGPSSLRMSDATNPLGSWPTANQAFIAKDDGQQGMGLSSYTIAETGISPTATLVAFKNYSAYQISGVFGASNFAVQRIKSDMGCLAPRSLQFVSGFGIIRLTHKGFALYNGVDDKLISEEIRPAIFGDPSGPLSHAGGVAGINFTSINRSWATQSQNPPLYVCAAPLSGSTTLTRLFVYDLIRKAWTICDYPTAFQCLALITTPATQPQVQAGASTGGTLQRLFSGDTTDNGTAINWSFRTRPVTPNPPTELAYFRRATLDVLYTPTQNVTVLVTPAGQTAFSRTAVFNAPGGGALWGSGTSVWGTFKWGTAGTVESRVSIDIQRTAPSAFLDVSGTGIVRCRAISWQAVTKPLTRARG